MPEIGFSVPIKRLAVVFRPAAETGAEIPRWHIFLTLRYALLPENPRSSWGYVQGD